VKRLLLFFSLLAADAFHAKDSVFRENTESFLPYRSAG
jgi:hypothetical protein